MSHFLPSTRQLPREGKERASLLLIGNRCYVWLFKGAEFLNERGLSHMVWGPTYLSLTASSGTWDLAVGKVLTGFGESDVWEENSCSTFCGGIINARTFCSLLVFFRAPNTTQLAKYPRVLYVKPLNKLYRRLIFPPNRFNLPSKTEDK